MCPTCPFREGSPTEFLRLSLAWIIPATAVTALFFVVVVGAGLRAQRLPVQSGVDTMRGKTAQATTGIDAGGGKIFVEGEYWNAVSPVPVAAGATVRIVGINGLTLHVQPVDGEKGGTPC
jgi:membrane-bound serine protease (ClpP class)